MGIWIVTSFLQLQFVLLWTFLYMSLCKCEKNSSRVHSTYLEEVNSILQVNAVASKVLTTIFISTQCARVPSVIHPSDTWCRQTFKICACSVGVYIYLPLIINEAGLFPIGLLVSFLLQNSRSYILPVFPLSCLLTEFLEFLILDSIFSMAILL